MEETLYELGIDINSSFSFHDGDIVMSEYDNNLVQAIVNRLSTDLNELDLFYESDYGSVLTGFLGWKANDETLSFIKSELETVLKNEVRLTTWSYDVQYTDQGKLRIDLILNPTEDYSISTTLEVGDDEIEVIE